MHVLLYAMSNDVCCNSTFVEAFVALWISSLVYTNSLKFYCETSLFAYVNHVQISSWNQPVLSNECNVFCSRKQWKSMTGLVLMTDQLRVRCSNHCIPRPTFLWRTWWLNLCHNLFAQSNNLQTSYLDEGATLLCYAPLRRREGILLCTCRLVG